MAALVLALVNLVFVWLFFQGREGAKQAAKGPSAPSLERMPHLLLLGRAATSMAFRGMEGTFAVYMGKAGDAKSTGRVFLAVGLVMVSIQGPLRVGLSKGASPLLLAVAASALMGIGLVGSLQGLSPSEANNPQTCSQHYS